MRGPEDCFDRFVACATKFILLRWFAKWYAWNKEFWLYALFGLGTILFSINTYSLFTENWNWPILIANTVSWIFATMFAFLTNRSWVFTNRKTGKVAFVQQMFSFFSGRFATLILEDLMLFVFVQHLGLPNMLIKYIAQFVIIIANYFISKWLVFRRRAVILEEVEHYMDEKNHYHQ